MTAVHTDSRRQEIARLWIETTLPADQIGERFGVSKDVILGLVYRMNLPKRRLHPNGRGPALRPDQVAEVRRRLRDGASVRALAIEFRCGVSTIYCIRNGRYPGVDL
jgi:hypothetical protein